MNYSKLKEAIKSNKHLILLILLTSIITTYLINTQIRIGAPYWDVFIYLTNALYFAGMGGMGITNFSYLPPIMPFLTSLVFRLGYISSNVIFILDGIIFVIGVIGLYMLFKLRFNNIQSLTGSLIFISFPLVMSWATAGNIDVPAVSFSIWAIYFTVLGLKRDSKFLYLMLILAAIAFLTRYTSVLLIFPILLYILINKNYINKNYIKHFKKIDLVILALFIAIPVLVFVYGNLSSLFNLFILTAFGSVSMANDVAYNPNIHYYLGNILNYISVGPFQGTYSSILNPSQSSPSLFSYSIGIITSIGLLVYVYKIVNTIRVQKYDKLKLKSLNTIKIALLVILVAIFIITFSQVTYILSEIVFFAICYIAYGLLKNSEIKNIDIDFLFISWFMAYFIFHSYHAVKVDRYFITMTPALAYFIILGLSEFLDIFKSKIKNNGSKTWKVYIVIALLFLSSATVTYVGHMPKKCFTVDIEQACDWLKEYDPNYKDKTIFSDYSSASSWYLKKGVSSGLPRLYNTPKDFSNYLKINKADYYIDTISKPKLDISGYHKIKNIGTVTIYEKNKN